MTYRHFLFACVLALLPVWAGASQVSASVDRDSVQWGDTVTLNVRISDAGARMAAPDLGPLQQDFQVLGTSQNSSLSVVNGKASSELTFGVALRPRRVGVLTIPALEVAGTRTAPLQVTVTQADPAAAAASGKDVFMEAQVEPSHGYVGQQMAYVIRLFYATSLSGDAPQPAQVDGVEISPLGKSLKYETRRAGRTYQVFEQHYALIPQRAGTIEIPPAVFQGQTTDPRDPGSFFGVTVPVNASTQAQTIQVKPAPAGFANNAWLPARKLSLSLDGWPGTQAPARVGQPLNLTMNLQATGLSYEVLPALTLPTLDGATVYPDKPVTGNHQDGPWVVGRRQQSFAIVPDRAGVLTIPAMTLKWWNVLTDSMEVATIPAHHLEVLPAAGHTGVAPPAATEGKPSADAAVGSSHQLAQTAISWRELALGSLALWLLSVLAWWLLQRRKRVSIQDRSPATSGSARSLQLAFLAAARGNDAAAQERSLLAWARAQRPEIQHLGELALALDDAAQRAAISGLQRRRYAGAPGADSDGQLAPAFRHGLVWRSAATSKQHDALAPLYPFKLQ